jgi:hypothetical protein
MQIDQNTRSTGDPLESDSRKKFLHLSSCTESNFNLNQLIRSTETTYKMENESARFLFNEKISWGGKNVILDIYLGSVKSRDS